MSKFEEYGGQRRKNSTEGTHKLARLPVPILRGRTHKPDHHTPPLPQQRGASRRPLPCGPKGGDSDNAETSAISAQATGLRTKATLQTLIPRKNPGALYTAQDEDITPTIAGPSPPSEKSTSGGREPSPRLRRPPRNDPGITGHQPAGASIIWPCRTLRS